MERTEESNPPIDVRGIDPEMDYSGIMLWLTTKRMEDLWKQINDKFLHKEKTEGLYKLALEYSDLSIRLLYLAELRRLEVKRDKEVYAPHPTFYS